MPSLLKKTFKEDEVEGEVRNLTIQQDNINPRQLSANTVQTVSQAPAHEEAKKTPEDVSIMRQLNSLFAEKKSLEADMV